QQPFFTFYGAAAYHHRPGAGMLKIRSQPPPNRRRTRRAHIDFLFAAYLPEVAGRADVARPGGILGGLCQKQINVQENSLQDAPKATVSGQGTIGNARIPHATADAAGMSEPQEIWPEFSFRQNNQPRPQDR